MASKSACLLFASLLIVSFVSVEAQSCKPVPLDTPTRWGGNEVIEVDVRSHPVRSVRGVVESQILDLIPDALVQIYKREHSDPLYRSPGPQDPLPVAACVTGDDGRFSFELPAGEYELRASMNKGMDVTHVYFIVGRGWRRSRRFLVTIHPGT